MEAWMDGNVSRLESKVRSTLLFGGSAPVSFMGEARLKIQDHLLTDYPKWMTEDRTWTASNWEGNESFVRLAMIARPGRNAVLWTKLGFQHTLPGIHDNDQIAGTSAERDGFTPVQVRHDKSNETVNIHEDMSAGLAIRTVPASFWLRLGNVLWTEASPLTIWKAQPRTFAWDYLPFEVEQPIARYYEYNIARGEKAGRAAWNKKAFNGVQFESVDMPYDLYFNFLFGTFERYDNFEREFMDFASDVAYADLDQNDAKGKGIGDRYRHLYHARLAKPSVFKDLGLSLNYAGIRYKPDILYNDAFRKVFSQERAGRNSPATGFYKQSDVYSVETRGSLSENLSIHTDVAFGLLDTSYVLFSEDTLATWSGERSPKAALFAEVRSKYGLPIELDLAFIQPGFYSPFSFAAPMDAFFPFGANMVGAGKFIGRGEGSPYSQNMTGAMIKLEPDVGYGHLRLIYGQHAQVEKGQDILFFPYRLNGQDVSTFFHTSYNRWGNNLIDHSLSNKYTKRLGDESYKTTEYLTPFGPDAGGLRSDYLSVFEGFVPYEDSAQAAGNMNSRTTIFSRDSNGVPVHRKWTFNFEVDAAYDVGPIVGYDKDLLLGAYFALNGVSTTITPAAFSQKDMLLWGYYARFEPAIALTPKLYLLGLAGYENWRSDMAWMREGTTEVKKVPIDYRDYAFGIGMDWDMAQRVGLHLRYKQMYHDDVNFSQNSWTARVVSGEIKMWF